MHSTESFLVTTDNTESFLVTMDNTESFLVTMRNTESFLVNKDNRESSLVTTDNTESFLVTMHSTESFLVTTDNTESFLVTMHNTESFLVTKDNTESFLVTTDNTESFLVTMHSTESLGWLADVFSRCDDYRSLPSPALCFPDFPDSGHPPSPIGVFPPPESKKIWRAAPEARRRTASEKKHATTDGLTIYVFSIQKYNFPKCAAPTVACMST